MAWPAFTIGISCAIFAKSSLEEILFIFFAKAEESLSLALSSLYPTLVWNSCGFSL
jgi:hypothetical protein